MRGRELVVFTEVVSNCNIGGFDQGIREIKCLHFWAKASWSDNTPSNSPARSNTSFRMYWENSRAHLAFPRTMRSTSV